MALFANFCYDRLDMQSMNISLPESMKNFVETEVASGGYSTASEFIRDLLREAQKRKARAKVDALLLEGLQSETSELTQADWNELKRRVRVRGRSRKASK
jgi:antitoxin ParD1/3/4